MNLTLKGKIFASRILLCGTVFIISIIMVFAPMFSISWQEKEYSIEYYLYTEYSVFDYFFADEIEVHFDVSEKQDEYIEDLLGTPTIKLQSIKAYEKKAVLWIAFIVDLVFIFTISRSRAIVKKKRAIHT